MQIMKRATVDGGSAAKTVTRMFGGGVLAPSSIAGAVIIPTGRG
jgi:hypothetical protein